MENASKALLIAGSILIVILLIAVGMMVFGGAQSNIEGSISSMSTQEVEAFNNQYLMYNGDQKGSSVKSMINKVIANNSNEDGRDITINSEEPTGDLLNDYVNTKTYKVSFDYDTTSGAIKNINIDSGSGGTGGVPG